MRSFAGIIAEEKQQRNILEIHLVKKTATDNTGIEGQSQRARALTFDDLGELIFDIFFIYLFIYVRQNTSGRMQGTANL